MSLYPDGYGTALVTLEQLDAKHGPRMHPTFRTQLFAYLAHKGGEMGIGGGWRAGGSQPDRPGFAAEGKSFHQDQRFASGVVGYCAVDLVCRNGSSVHRAPRWTETTDAPGFLLHTFIQSPPEPWHIQPINIRGWQTWVDSGRPDPTAPPPAPLPIPPTEDDMPTITFWQGEPWPIAVFPNPEKAGWTWRGIDGPEVEELIDTGLARDGRSEPLPAAWKSKAWMVRLG